MVFCVSIFGTPEQNVNMACIRIVMMQYWYGTDTYSATTVTTMRVTCDDPEVTILLTCTYTLG